MSDWLFIFWILRQWNETSCKKQFILLWHEMQSKLNRFFYSFSFNRQFCLYGYVFDPTSFLHSIPCVRLDETECSRKYLRLLIWRRFPKSFSESVNDVGNGWNLNQHPPISSAFIEFSSDWQRMSATITGLIVLTNVNLYPPQLILTSPLIHLIQQRIQQRIQRPIQQRMQQHAPPLRQCWPPRWNPTTTLSAPTAATTSSDDQDTATSSTCARTDIRPTFTFSYAFISCRYYRPSPSSTLSFHLLLPAASLRRSHSSPEPVSPRSPSDSSNSFHFMSLCFRTVLVGRNSIHPGNSASPAPSSNAEQSSIRAVFCRWRGHPSAHPARASC